MMAAAACTDNSNKKGTGGMRRATVLQGLEPQSIGSVECVLLSFQSDTCQGKPLQRPGIFGVKIVGSFMLGFLLCRSTLPPVPFSSCAPWLPSCLLDLRLWVYHCGVVLFRVFDWFAGVRFLLCLTLCLVCVVMPPEGTSAC